ALECRRLLSAMYVSTVGNGANAGTLPDAPLRTIGSALERVTPGTTVFIAGGTYQERLVARSPGSPGAWITLASIDGTAVIDGSTFGGAPAADQNVGVVELRAPFYRMQNVAMVNAKDTGIVLGANNLTIEHCQIAQTQRHAIATDT